MTRPPEPSAERPSQRVCYCRDVDEATLRRAIRDGAHTIEAIAEATSASTGCGTCRFDLEKLLVEELSRERPGNPDDAEGPP